MKRIVIACGTGMATSTLISAKVKELLDNNNIKYNLVQCQLSEIDTYKDTADLFVTAMKVVKDYNVPIVVGTPFLIGIGEEEVENKILDILKG